MVIAGEHTVASDSALAISPLKFNQVNAETNKQLSENGDYEMSQKAINVY